MDRLAVFLEYHLGIPHRGRLVLHGELVASRRTAFAGPLENVQGIPHGRGRLEIQHATSGVVIDFVTKQVQLQGNEHGELNLQCGKLLLEFAWYVFVVQVTVCCQPLSGLLLRCPTALALTPGLRCGNAK
jgi:hypothetical protein